MTIISSYQVSCTNDEQCGWMENCTSLGIEDCGLDK